MDQQHHQKRMEKKHVVNLCVAVLVRELRSPKDVHVRLSAAISSYRWLADNSLLFLFIHRSAFGSTSSRNRDSKRPTTIEKGARIG